MPEFPPLWERLYLRVRPPASTFKTPEIRRQIGEFLTPREDGSLILNLGSGSTSYGPRVVNLDFFHAPGVQVVGDAHTLPIRSGSVGAVFCQAVLEHVPRPAEVVREILRVLRPGGKVFVDVPFTYPYHDRMDYQRYTQDGLRELFRDFEILDVEVSVGPATAMINQISWTLAALLSFRRTALFWGWHTLLGWLLFPLRYLNLLLRGNRFARAAAAGHCLLARKPIGGARFQGTAGGVPGAPAA